MKLHLGCGNKILDGYLNVDKFGTPEFQCDLEKTPWPWHDSTVDEILMIHVLEHLGQQTETYIGIIKEMYRVCQNGATIRIIVPHFRHDNFWGDPTHVRAVTPDSLRLFSKKFNQECISRGSSHSTLGIYHNVDFDLTQTVFYPSHEWQSEDQSLERLMSDAARFNNVIEQIEMILTAVK